MHLGSSGWITISLGNFYQYDNGVFTSWRVARALHHSILSLSRVIQLGALSLCLDAIH